MRSTLLLEPEEQVFFDHLIELQRIEGKLRTLNFRLQNTRLRDPGDFKKRVQRILHRFQRVQKQPHEPAAAA